MTLLISLFSVVFLSISSLLSAETYYVSPSGNNGDPGTISKPWLTWDYAFSRAVAGDTVYFRGGSYPLNTGAHGIVADNSGTSSDWICFFNYPGEKPIIDCSNKTIGESSYMKAMTIWNASYIHLKGLNITNFPELQYGGSYTTTSGLDVYMSHHLIFENMEVSNIGGESITINGCNEVLVKNCDSWNACDSHSFWPGQNGTGFGVNNRVDNFDESMYYCHIYFEGCRTWNFSDNGFAIQGVAYVEMKNCWAFKGGALNGEGCGFKYSIGSSNNTTNPLSRLIINCISAYNGHYGFSPNNNGGTAFNGHYYNNISYHNGYNHELLNWTSDFGAGFCLYNHSGVAPYELYANNIAYDNEYIEVYEGGSYAHENNSWDHSVTVSDGDFLSLDYTEMLKSRKADGSLPDINFMKLATGSDLIDAGTTKTGLPYNGSAPDLGWYETSGFSETKVSPVYINSSVENATPSRLELTYNLTLANIVPPASAFSVMVNSSARTVSSVAISGTKVQLTLSSPVVYGNVVTVAYTKPASNPLQTSSGGQAASITAQSVTNNVGPVSPVYVSSVIENATPSRIDLTYNLTLANTVPAASAFSVMVNSSARTVSSVAISGTKVQLTLSSPVVYGNVVTVAYTKPASNPLQTSSGGQAASITAQSVTNNVGPVSPVYVSSVIENATPSRIDLTYNLTLANTVPAASAFSVMVNSSARSVSSVAVSGTKVQLTLSSPVVYGNVVTVAYTKPSTNPLQTSAGGQAASITAQSVTNNVGPVSPVYVSSVIENATPSRLDLTYNLSLANIVPAASAFSVMVNSSARSVSSVAISGTKVQLTLSSPVVYGNVVTVAYTKPASNPLQTSSGGQVASITAQSVTNNVGPVSPVYVSSVIENATPSRLDLTYNLTLVNIVPAASAFSIMVNSSAITVSSVAISDTKVQLTLARPVVNGEVVTVAYTKPASNPLQTASGGQAASFSSQNVTNNVSAVSPVYVSSVVENATPARLEMTYNLTLANIVPAVSAFTVNVNSSLRTVSSVAISGTKILLTLSSPVVYDDLVTIAYTKPSTNPLQTSSGGQAASISAQSVNNNCRLPSNQPPVADILSPSKSSSFNAPATIILEVNASDPDGTITKVEFYNGAIKIGETTNSPYLFTWKDVPAGTFSITAAATDNLNARSVSSAVTIVVSNVTTSINQLPFVSISSPKDNISIIVPSTVTVTAEATDVDGNISKVEFFLDDIKIAEDFTSPYTLPMEFLKAGLYKIKAVAIDNLNAVSASSVITLYTELGNKSDIISLYPNPNDGRFTIRLLTDILIGENKIIITRGNGKIVYSGVLLKEENTRQFDLSHLESGIYVIMIFSDRLVYTKKFIKR